MTFSGLVGRVEIRGRRVVRRLAIMEVQVVEDRKNIFITNLLILNLSKGLSYICKLYR